MKIKAITAFTAFDEGRMKVFNIGDTDDVTDALAQGYIDAGKARHVGDKPQLDHDGDGKAGGSKSAGADDELQALRADYREKLGKNVFGGWDADELRRRIAEHEAAQEGDGEAGGSDEPDEDAPPV